MNSGAERAKIIAAESFMVKYEKYLNRELKAIYDKVKAIKKQFEKSSTGKKAVQSKDDIAFGFATLLCAYIVADTSQISTRPKHALWNALLVHETDYYTAKLLGDTHEMSNFNWDKNAPYLGDTIWIGASMDLYYNDLGREIAVQNPSATKEQLIQLVYQAIMADDSRVQIGSSEEYSVRPKQ